MKARIASVAAALTLAVSAQAAPVNLIVNGGFESTSVNANAWVNVASIDGWKLDAGPGHGFEVRNNVAGAAHGGKNFIELDTDGNTTIIQTLDTLTFGASYTLDFWYSPRVGVGAASNGIAVYWNGSLLDSLTGDGGSANFWTEHSYNVTALQGRNVVGFAAIGRSDSLGGNLDDVSLVARTTTNANASKVPEPASLVLTGGALLLLGLQRRRRL